MSLNKYNIFSNIRNDQFLPNIVEGDKDSSFNSDENAIINNQILIPLEPNDFFRSDDNIYKSTWYTKGPINYEIHGCSSRVYAVGYFGYMLRAIGNYYNAYLAECGNSDSSMGTMLTYYAGVGSHNFNSFNHIECNNLSRYSNPIRYTDTTILSLKPTKR